MKLLRLLAFGMFVAVIIVGYRYFYGNTFSTFDIPIKTNEELSTEEYLNSTAKNNGVSKRLTDLKVGETGYVSDKTVVVIQEPYQDSPDGKYYVHKSAFVFPKQSYDHAAVRISREENGFTGVADPYHTDISPAETGKVKLAEYESVAMAERAAERQMIDDMTHKDRGYISLSDIQIRRAGKGRYGSVGYYISRTTYTTAEPTYARYLLTCESRDLQIAVPPEATAGFSHMPPNADLRHYRPVRVVTE